MVVRAFRPGATGVTVVLDGGDARRPADAGRRPVRGGAPRRDGAGPERPSAGKQSYRLEVEYPRADLTVDDPYRFWPTLGDVDLHLIGEGRHEGSGGTSARTTASTKARAGTAFAVWAPNARSGARGRRLQRVGRRACTRCASLGSSGVWELFVPGVGAGRPVQVRGRHRRRRARRSRPTRSRARPRCRPARPAWCRRVAARLGATTAWLAERAAADPLRPRRCRSTRCTSARGGAACGGYRALDLPRAGRAGYVGRPGLHPRRAPAGRRAPVRRLVGLPGDVVLRADSRFGSPDDFRYLVDRLHQAGHRRDRRLGAGPLPEGRLGAGPLRRHRALRARRPPPGRASRLGHARLQLRPQRGAQLPRGQRPVLDRGVPHRRPAGRRGRLDALPRLLPSSRASGCPTRTAGARTSRRSPSCRRRTRSSTASTPA